VGKRQNIPIALTIAGSDSGGGAGLQADLKAFAALGVHGTTAVTCVTAQNPRKVFSIHPCPPATVRAQIEALFAELPPAAVKTGMLFNAATIRVVAEFFRKGNRPPLVVDPVMVATSGARLLTQTAVHLYQRELLPLATLMTPNLDEAEILSERKLRSIKDLREAARAMQSRYGCAVLLKGGHLKSLPDAVDVFWDGRRESLLSAPFVRGISTHGTGCTYSAAIAAYLAHGRTLPEAVRRAKAHITQAIARSVKTAGHDVLNNFWK
jgi:hydroxymethylpyrimidine/phosphomethylpyrimidine kinase